MTPKRTAFLDGYPKHVVKTAFGKDFDQVIAEVPLAEADYLFFSESTPDHHAAAPQVIKVFVTGENACPDFNATDYAISSEYMEYGDRHLRFPYYASEDAAKVLFKRPKLTLSDLKSKPGFCNFIYSNQRLADPIRDRFFHELNAVIPVVSAGRHLCNDNALANNDDPDWGAAKRAFVKQFRFTIAFENSSHPGYTTEKLTHALLARTIPIYWGDPRVCDEFNPDAFVHLRDYSSTADAIATIKSLDSSPEQSLEILNANVFANDKDCVEAHLKNARFFIENIFSQPQKDARRRPRYGRVLMLEKKRRNDQMGWKRRLKRNRF